MKKIISIILCVTLCMSMCITTALGAEETKGVKTVLEYNAVMSGIDGFIDHDGLIKLADADGTVHTSVPTTPQYFCRLGGEYEADGKSIRVPTGIQLNFSLNQSSDTTWPVGETRYIEYKFNFTKISGKYVCVLLEIPGAYCEMKGLNEGDNYLRAEITKTASGQNYSMVAYGSGNITLYNSSYSSTGTTFKDGNFCVKEVNMGVVTEKRSTDTRQYTEILKGLSNLNKVDGKNQHQAAFDSMGNSIAYSADDTKNCFINVYGPLNDNKINLTNYSTSWGYCIQPYNFPSNANVGDIYKLKLDMNITETAKFDFSIGGMQSGKYFEIKNAAVGDHTMVLSAEMTSDGYNCTLTWDGNNVNANSWNSYTTNFLCNTGAGTYLTNIEIGVEKPVAAKGAILTPISENGRAKVEICQTETETLAAAVLISAIYTADNELVGLNTYELPLDGKADNKYYEYWCTATPEKEEGNLVYKAFLWDSMSGLTPIPASN